MIPAESFIISINFTTDPFLSFLFLPSPFILGLPGGRDQESTCRCRRCGFDPHGWEDPLEKEMAAHSSILAWEILRTEEPGGLQSVGSQRLGRD